MNIAENTCLIKAPFFDRMTADDFFDLCQANETLNFERDENGNIILMPPTGSQSSVINNTITYQLTHWNRKSKSGVVLESNGGVTLPDGSSRAADGAWISNEKWNALSEQEKEKFAPVCPEFIIELRSKNDSLSYLQSKMDMWISNGVIEAWLIDPIEEHVYIYTVNGGYKLIPNFNEPIGTDKVLPGFELDLSELKRQRQ